MDAHGRFVLDELSVARMLSTSTYHTGILTTPYSFFGKFHIEQGVIRGGVWYFSSSFYTQENSILRGMVSTN